jgi:phage terminase large subunit-like protein
VHLCAPRAQRVVRFFERVLVHTKGVYAGRPFTLTAWQRDQIIVPLFGMVEYSEESLRWVRVYRVAWIELARKNGKSELLAGIALYLLVGENEQGAEIYGCARDRDQARKVYDVAERMVNLSPPLRKRLGIYKQSKRIYDARTASYYQVVAADAAGNLGHNPHGILYDEIVAAPSADLWNAMRTAMGARAQPLMLAATTAGNDPHSFAAAEHAYCERIAQDPDLDRRRFVFIRSTPVEYDWRDEEGWRHANPALGDFLSLDALRDEAREAALSPSKLNVFRQFRMNQWVHNESRWLPLARWDQPPAGEPFDEDELAAHRCYGGLDLANTTDLCALAWTFPPTTEDGDYRTLWRFWIPEARRADLNSRTADLADAWERDGWLTFTPGDVLDHKSVVAQITADAVRFDVQDLGFDRFGMSQMMTDLADEGITVVPIGQGFVSMSSPTKELERLVLAARFHHGGNPVARWCLSNVVVQRDAAGNEKPHRERSRDKIDGIVAAIMALDRATRNPRTPKRSAYDDSPLMVV